MHTNLTSQSGPEDTHVQSYRDSSSDYKIHFEQIENRNIIDFWILNIDNESLIPI